MNVNNIVRAKQGAAQNQAGGRSQRNTGNADGGGARRRNLAPAAPLADAAAEREVYNPPVWKRKNLQPLEQVESGILNGSNGSSGAAGSSTNTPGPPRDRARRGSPAPLSGGGARSRTGRSPAPASGDGGGRKPGRSPGPSNRASPGPPAGVNLSGKWANIHRLREQSRQKASAQDVGEDSSFPIQDHPTQKP